VDLEVPIVGPEENAADYIATIVLMSGEDPRDASRAERARQLVAAAASGFAAEWTTTRPPVAELPFWDSHGAGEPDARRKPASAQSQCLRRNSQSIPATIAIITSHSIG
jgi:hypothetical protein